MPVRGISRAAPIGKRFGRVVVISPPVQSGWNCVSVTGRCDCGDERLYFVTNITRQAEPMCPQCRTNSRPAKGMSDHPLFTIWKGIVQRCENPKHTAFHCYGGRGITMCSEWRQDFTRFVQDVGERPSMRHTLDRIDNSQGYRPGNVRWATQVQQGRNRRTNQRIEWQGADLTFAEAAEIAAVDVATLAYRIKSGWSVADAMTKPSRSPSIKGKPKTRLTPNNTA